MNLRVHADGAGSSGPLEGSRPEKSSASSHSALGPSAGVLGTGGDTVAISEFSTRVSHALSADEVRGADRVAELARLYARGEYRPDPAALSHALVSRAINQKAEVPGSDGL